MRADRMRMQFIKQHPILHILSFGLLLFLVACSHNQTRTPAPTPTLPPQASALGNKLQLRNFTPPVSATIFAAPTTPPVSATATPTPVPTATICPRYTPVDGTPPNCKCPEVPICDYGTGQVGSCQFDAQICRELTMLPDLGFCSQTQSPQTQQCYDDLLAGRCKLWCAAKPVIYLYPESLLVADVKLAIDGIVTVSDPLYPQQGWKDVLALPSGELFYEGKQYPYLYYETEVSKPAPPTEGIVVEMESLQPMLTLITSQLGLLPHEQKDFLDYWVPRLQKEVTTPYLSVGLVSHTDKERIDKVIITPEPDTRIELLFQFTPLKSPIVLPALQLPKTPPQRTGFVMIEWGGGITELVQ